MPPTQAGDRPPMLIRMVGLGRSFAPIPGLANPARSLACLELAPTLWGPSSRLRQPGAWIPPTPSVRGRLNAVGTAIAKAILVPMRGASVLRPGCGGRLPCPSQAPTTPGAAWSGLAKSPASRLPRPPLLPAESLPRVFAPPARARPYARGYLSVGHGSPRDKLTVYSGLLNRTRRMGVWPLHQGNASYFQLLNGGTPHSVATTRSGIP